MFRIERINHMSVSHIYRCTIHFGLKKYKVKHSNIKPHLKAYTINILVYQSSVFKEYICTQ